MIETTKCKIFEFKINSYKLAWISIVKNLNDFNRFIISEDNYIKKINIEIEEKDRIVKKIGKDEINNFIDLFNREYIKEFEKVIRENVRVETERLGNLKDWRI